MVLDNKTAARLQIGDQVPITTQTATSTLITANTAIVNSIDAGHRRHPVGDAAHQRKRRVQLQIEQEVSAVSYSLLLCQRCGEHITRITPIRSGSQVSFR